MARQKGPLDAVQFTRESAERVARVVRAAETAVPAGEPLRFARRFVDDRPPKQVRAATFSGAWPIGSSKIVTFKYVPTATANVVNLSWPITLTGYVNEDCIVGREGTNWWLVVPKLEARTAVFGTQTATASFATGTSTATYVTGTANATVVSGVTANTATITFLSDVSVTASLNTADCSITVGVTKSSGTATAVQSVSVSTASVQVASGTATAVFASGMSSVTFITGTVTATFLRIRVP
jgi:hypothetical protein